MNKFRLFLLPVFALGLYSAQAQVKVGDNPTNVNGNAIFEMESTNKGVLFPRMALTAANSPSPLSAFVAGMTVYNTATAGSGVNAITPGLYYSDGTKWMPIGKDWAEDQSLGSIAVFPFASVPSTYLICNGQAISRTTYAALYAKIGTTYGAGDGSTTFNLPDLRGEFIRGWDNGRGVDSGRALGSTQAQGTARPTTAFTGTTSTDGAHTHTVTITTQLDGVDDYNYTQDSQLGDAGAVSSRTKTTSINGNHSHTLTVNGGGDSETRPRNVAMVYAIKAVESIIVSGSSGSGTTYNGSTSVTLNGTSFERAALTGDVTATANSNATTIAPNAVTSAKIADGTIVTADLADSSVTSAKIVDSTVANADLATGTGGIYKGSGSLSGNTTVTMGTNTLDFPSTATTGTSHFTVDGTTLNVDAVNNRVGIGTIAPWGKLHLSGDSSGSNFVNSSIVSSNTGTGGHTWAFGARPLGTNGDFSISDETDGQTRMTLQGGTGRIGIGTTQPIDKLSVVENGNNPVAITVTNNSGTGRLAMSSFTGSYAAPNSGDVVLNNLSESSGIALTRGNVLGMYINSSNNVGIGTSSPNAKLTTDAFSVTEKAFSLRRQGVEKLFFVPELDLYNYNGLTTAGDIGIFFGNSSGGGIGTATSRGLVIAPWTGNQNGMKITEAGNVGIGTSNPTTPLQVNGAMRVGTSGQTAASAGAGAMRYNSTSGQMEYSNGTSWVPFSGNSISNYGAYGSVDLGDIGGGATGARTIYLNYNIASASKPATNAITINFSTPMPNANYHISMSVLGNYDGTAYPWITSRTTTGFTVRFTEYAGVGQSGTFEFIVFPRN